jgi:hypothetical protein
MEWNHMNGRSTIYISCAPRFFHPFRRQASSIFHLSLHRGGKSACQNTLSFIQSGVTVTILPLLSLGADQTAKLQSLAGASHLPIKLYHLDKYRAGDANRSLRRLIHQLTEPLTPKFVSLEVNLQRMVQLSSVVDKKTICSFCPVCGQVPLICSVRC